MVTKILHPFDKDQCSGAALAEYISIISSVAVFTVIGVHSFTGSTLNSMCRTTASITVSGNANKLPSGSPGDGFYFQFYYGDHGGVTHRYTDCYVYEYSGGSHTKTLLWDTF